MRGKKLNNINRIATKGELFPPKYAFTLLIPLRNLILSPRKLIKRLGLKENDNVLELGAGPGYFSAKVAKALPKGMLTLTDIQDDMLELAKKRMKKKQVHNVRFYLCNGVDFNFEDSEFDCIYMVTVLGEIENRQLYINEFQRLIPSGGLLSISEQAGDPDKISIPEIKKLFEDTMFELEQVYVSKANFTINFRKK